MEFHFFWNWFGKGYKKIAFNNPPRKWKIPNYGSGLNRKLPLMCFCLPIMRALAPSLITLVQYVTNNHNRTWPITKQLPRFQPKLSSIDRFKFIYSLSTWGSSDEKTHWILKRKMNSIWNEELIQKNIKCLCFSKIWFVLFICRRDFTSQYTISN